VEVDLIYGGFGQDGIITSEILTAKKMPHVRIGRSRHKCYLEGERHCLFGRSCSKQNSNDFSLPRLLRENSVRDVYFYAAHHASAENRSAGVDDAIESFRVNYHLFNRVLVRLLEKSSPRAVFYANSSKIFEESDQKVVAESSQSSPRTAYAESKAMVRELIDSLKDQLPFRIYNGILFNHESIHRKPDFFTSKVISQAIEVSRGMREFVEIKTLNGEVDMSLAVDFCESIVRLNQSAAPSGDYVLASGRTISLRYFMRLVFERLGVPGFPIDETSEARKESGFGVIVGNNGKICRAVDLKVRTPEELVPMLVDQRLAHGSWG
jgi:GDPmannose 4,6-dehydratase